MAAELSHSGVLFLTKQDTPDQNQPEASESFPINRKQTPPEAPSVSQSAFSSREHWLLPPKYTVGVGLLASCPQQAR